MQTSLQRGTDGLPREFDGEIETEVTTDDKTIQEAKKVLADDATDQKAGADGTAFQNDEATVKDVNTAEGDKDVTTAVENGFELTASNMSKLASTPEHAVKLEDQMSEEEDINERALLSVRK